MPTSKSTGQGHASRQKSGSTNSTSIDNGHAYSAADQELNAATSTSSSSYDMAAEAYALRDYLREGYSRAHRLCVLVRHCSKQSKIVASTLASLRKLQQIEG